MRSRLTITNAATYEHRDGQNGSLKHTYRVIPGTTVSFPDERT
jgi:hypothetical protein